MGGGYIYTSKSSSPSMYGGTNWDLGLGMQLKTENW